jgi:membrane protease YdiL (CAAX protease family)
MSEPPPVSESTAAPREWLRPALVRSWTEFVVVAALAMALPIRNSTVAALHGSSSRFMQIFLSDSKLEWSIFIEGILLALFLVYLHWRGWKPADLRIRLGWLTTAEGLGLFVVCQVVVSIVVGGLIGIVFALQSTWHTFPQFLLTMMPHIAPHSLHVSWLSIVVAMVVNAFFEEVVCMGYIFNQLAARRGPVVALAGTVFLRAACHTYQDPIHLAGIAVLFTLYGAFYWYGRKLWPLIFAHLLLDIMSMSALKLIFR